jgi:hypothetical protein
LLALVNNVALKSSFTGARPVTAPTETAVLALELAKRTSKLDAWGGCSALQSLASWRWFATWSIAGRRPRSPIATGRRR